MAQDAAGEVEVRVLRVLAKCTGLDEGDIAPSDRLRVELGLSSVDLVDLSFRLDEEFGGRFDLSAEAGGAGADLTARQVANAVRAGLAREGPG